LGVTVFHWLNKQGVRSSAGFELQSMHRHYYHYTEGEKSMQVVVEPCRAGEHYYEEVAMSSFQRWLPPHEQELVTTEDVARIRGNVESALSFMGIKHTFV
jgi:hypothetical protein